MLGVEPEELSPQQWKSFAHHWRSYNEASTSTQAHCIHMNEVFANCSDEDDEIYPLTKAEIAAAQRADASLNVGMCDCWLQGIQPCKWKGNGHQ